MEQLLVTGIDTVVGANLAAHLSERSRIIGVSTVGPVFIDGCETATLPTDDSQAIRTLMANCRPNRLVICGVAGDSPWNQSSSRIASSRALDSARIWAQTSHDMGVPVTLITSDAVFTGPWMFHAESSSSLCQSEEARALRSLESDILAESEGALVVRTHAYGWNPLSEGLGWIEGILASLESERPGLFDCVPHATPILTMDLADIVHRAWAAQLCGVYHVAGAERSNPHRFAQAIAEVFELPPPRGALVTPAAESPLGFARGETSLHCRKIRRALGSPLPMLVDGLERLRAQKNDSHDRRFRTDRRMPASRVA